MNPFILMVTIGAVIALAFGWIIWRGRRDHAAVLRALSARSSPAAADGTSRLEGKKSLRDRVLGATGDHAIDLVYYDRKDDQDLPRGAIESLIEHGDITIEEIVAEFESALRGQLRGGRSPATDGSEDEEGLG